MVKQYLKYIPKSKFGVISSSHSNAIYDTTGQYAILPCLEEVKLWDLKKGVEVLTRFYRTTNSLRSPNYRIQI